MIDGKRTIGIVLSGGAHRVAIFALEALLDVVDSRRNRDVSVANY